MLTEALDVIMLAAVRSTTTATTTTTSTMLLSRHPSYLALASFTSNSCQNILITFSPPPLTHSRPTTATQIKCSPLERERETENAMGEKLHCPTAQNLSSSHKNCSIAGFFLPSVEFEMGELFSARLFQLSVAISPKFSQNSFKRCSSFVCPPVFSHNTAFAFVFVPFVCLLCSS